MMKIRLVVFYDKTYWTGIFEQIDHEQLTVSKIIFHQEPSDQEIYDFILHQYKTLRFSPSVEAKSKQASQNLKRRQREAAKEMNCLKSTKAQAVLKLAYETNKIAKKEKIRHSKKLRQERQFVLKQQKKKQKHRGR